ncbi:MAG: flavodoxin family protein [Candidatus Aminicenantales bacterium]
MAKILVTYFSKTGNTKMVAEAIYEALAGPKAILPLENVQEIDSYNLIFIGFPVHSHSVPYKVERFLKNIPAPKKIALFSTHGSLSGHRLSREALEHAVVLASRVKVLGTFSCRGKISIEAQSILNKSPEHHEWTEMAASAGTHPTATDLEEAKVFARQVLNLSMQGH